VKKDNVSTLKIAATYIGTVVGAGFATGQEVLQFFARFGILGLGGLFITAILFVVFGYIIMELGNVLRSSSHLEIIQHCGGKILGTIIDLVITFFLFGTLTIMIAGNGALFEQQFRLPAISGNLVMAVLTAITVLTGINGVINSISFVVPFLLTAVLGISIFSIINYPPDFQFTSSMTGLTSLVNNWLAAAILYVSYNTVVSIAILGPLGNKARDKKSIWYGAVLGGLGLGLGSVMIYMALLGHMADINKLEVPMLFIAGGISPVIQAVYGVVLVAEVYTTAVSSLFGFASRIVDVKVSTGKIRTVVVVTTAASLLVSRFGFSNLVKYLYPLVGYCGVILLIALVLCTLCKPD
jgi:uncharacterized membrane protein YkvI